MDKNFKERVDAAFNGGSTGLKRLGDYFRYEYFDSKDICLAKYIYELAKGNTPKAIIQYRMDSELYPDKKSERPANIWVEESVHLERTIAQIEHRINYLEELLRKGFSAYFLEMDIQADKMQKQAEIASLIRQRARPYYGRLDVFNGSNTKTYYIGEEGFGIQSNIVSVWSPFGRHFRQKAEQEFSEKGICYIVKRRRQIDIEDGQIIDIEDIYTNSTPSNPYVNGVSEKVENRQHKTVSDPFLKKILERKRGEKGVSNIIRSIQEKQNEIIDFDFDKNLIVQGCAGSGKTMILLHRLANLKYNRPETKWNNVKIITPNEKFNTYIDGLSESLGISVIPRRSLAEYYWEIIQQYAYDAGKNSGAKISGKKVYIKPDEELSKECVAFIYSSKFSTIVQNKLENDMKAKCENAIVSRRQELEREILELKEQKRNQGAREVKRKIEKEIQELERIKRELTPIKELSYAEQRRKIKKLIEEAVQGREISFQWPEVRDKDKSEGESSEKEKEEIIYQCLLYAEVLAHYLLKGAPRRWDQLLCIDEGQNISKLQYLLLYRVNGNRVCFNIYGDIGQKTSSTCGIDDWHDLMQFIKDIPGSSASKSVSLFYLKENYRNSEEITNFCNCRLRKNDRPLGIKIGREVKHIKANEVETYCKFHWLLKNRVVVICDRFADVPDILRPVCVFSEVKEGKISLMTVAEVKGLEFDVAIVFDQGMLEAEKYIAYTRSMSELYIVDSASTAFKKCN